MSEEPKRVDWATLKKKDAIAIYKEKLATDNRWALRALVVLGGKQTPTERSTLTTREQNGEGFNSFDAEILTSFYTKVIMGEGLSFNQMHILRRRITKYAGQLYNYSCCMGFSREKY